jgi:hypothetical protein
MTRRRSIHGSTRKRKATGTRKAHGRTRAKLSYLSKKDVWKHKSQAAKQG